MISLICSILCSTLLVLIFSQFAKNKIHTLQAIVVNYFVCVLCAWLTLGKFPLQATDFAQSWFPFAIFLGLNFIVGFNMVAGTVQHFGVPVASVMQKMSLVMVIGFTFFFYHEQLDFYKILGLITAFGAIWFSSRPEKLSQTAENKIVTQNDKSDKLVLIFPVLTLLLSGVIDVTFYYVQRTVSPQSGANLGFISFLFGTAGLFGFIFVLIGFALKKYTFEWKNVIAGTILGIPNFGSTFFFLKAMNEGWEGSVFFPLNNVGIIIVSTFAALFFLKEKITTSKIISIVLSLFAIFFITMNK